MKNSTIIFHVQYYIVIFSNQSFKTQIFIFAQQLLELLNQGLEDMLGDLGWTHVWVVTKYLNPQKFYANILQMHTSLFQHINKWLHEPKKLLR